MDVSYESSSWMISFALADVRVVKIYMRSSTLQKQFRLKMNFLIWHGGEHSSSITEARTRNGAPAECVPSIPLKKLGDAPHLCAHCFVKRGLFDPHGRDKTMERSHEIALYCDFETGHRRCWQCVQMKKRVDIPIWILWSFDSGLLMKPN